MFGWKRYNNDMLALVKETDLSSEQFFSKMNDIIVRLAKTNFAVGAISATVGGIAGFLGAEYILEIKKKNKKSKELKDTDK